MSRSLTAAARARYAPQSLCALWTSALSRTAAERFVEVVAGRWERAAMKLEEHLRARGPALSWSERVVGKGPRPRPLARGPAARETSPRGRDEPRSDREAWEEDRGTEAARLERTGAEARTASGRASRSPPSLSAARRMRGESPPASAAGTPPRATAEADARVPAAPGRREEVRVAAAGPPRSSPPRAAGDAGPWVQGPGLPGDRARRWDPVEDVGESARRRFEEWTLERRWREEALAEWRRREF